MSAGSTGSATSGGVGSADAGAGRERKRRLGQRRERTLTARLGVAAVWLYRLTLGALFPTTCKYHPSCSQYAIDAVRAKGLARGSLLAAWRVLRCNPWSHGGFDPVR